MKLLSTLLFLAICGTCICQNLSIHKNDKTDEITTSHFLEVGVKSTKLESCCDYITFTGYLLSTSQDSVKFNFLNSEITKELSLDKNDSSLNTGLFDYNPYKTIAKEDLLYITNFKSEKAKKNSSNRAGIGALLGIGGLVTILNAVFLDNNQRELFIIGGSQIAVGLTLGISSANKKKTFVGKDPWIIN